MIRDSLYNALNAHPRMLLMSLKWDDRSSFSWNLLIANFWAEKRDDRLVFTRFPKRFSLLTNMVRCFSAAALLLLMPIAYCWKVWQEKKLAINFWNFNMLLITIDYSSLVVSTVEHHKKLNSSQTSNCMFQDKSGHITTGPNFEHFQTSNFGPKPNFEHVEHHKKVNSSRTSNCLFQD